MKNTKTSEEFGPVGSIGDGVASAHVANEAGLGLDRLAGRRESAASARADKRRRALRKVLGALAIATTAAGLGWAT